MKVIYILTAIFTYYFVMFIIGQIKKNNSIVDIGWGMSFVVTAWISFSLGNKSLSGLLVTLLVTIWGMRLTYHIGKRNIGKPEDFRYVNFRKKWGTNFALLKAFLHVYMLQMVMSLLISSAFIYINLKSSGQANIYTVIGLIIWIVGFYFEAVGDYQLKVFKQNKSNKGTLLTSGLYKYTRHPNYFGEALMWWGIFVIGLASSYAYLTIISPITITVLVRYVSGVPMLEKHYEGREDFRVYAEKTSIFIPMLPKVK